MVAQMSAELFLGSGLSIKGTVISGEDLYFDGEVDGSVQADRSTVTVGPNARLTAGINARKVVIEGSVVGTIEASESIELRTTGNLVGNITTPRIVIEDGAYFKGSVDISRPETEPLSAKLASLDAAVYAPPLEQPATLRSLS